MLLNANIQPEAVTAASETIPNFRDVGRSINNVMGTEIMVEGRLFRGGAISHCCSPASCGDPDLIVCLRVEVDQGTWSRLVHAPKPDDLECYATGEKRIQQWLELPLIGISELDPGNRAYVHCRLGRDRTGVVIAALLATIEVPNWAIVEEFLISQSAEEVEIRRALAGMPAARDLLSGDVIRSLRANFRT